MFGHVTMLALYIIAIIVGPVFTIGALNTLFTLSIPLNVWTWLSAAWIQIILTSRSKVNNE